MNAEDISACNWGQSRLTVAPKVERIPSLRICDKCTTKIPSYSPTFTNRKSKMGFTTCPHTGDHKRTYIGRQSNSHFFRTSHKSESSKCHWNLKSCLNVHRVSQITVFILLALCSLSSASSTDRRPLKLTDATKREDFRYFMKSKDDTEEMIMSRSAIAANLADSDDSLAFQTLKVIEKWGNHTRDVLLVAGKDHVYMLDSTLLHNRPEIAYMERLTWRTLSETRKECEMLPGQPPELCENFIRFVELMDNGELMVCGTNAYSPACRFYRRDQFNDNGFEDSDYVRDDKCRGQCFVPYNPLTSSASLYTNTEYGSQIFLAVVNDFNSQEPKIMRQDSPTLISNSLWLNDPTFLKIIEYKDKVYVFFREVAQEGEVEYDDKEKVTLARVAQVCKNDPGGVNILAQQWTSFLKARLHCGYPKRQHLQFSNMTSVTDIVSVSDESGEELDVVFATFTTPWDWQDASLSAVCAFSMKDIIKVFEEGSFAGEYELTAQQDVASSPGVTATPVLNRANTIKRSYPIPSEKEPVPRPGGCSKTHSPNTLYFAKIHPSMYDVIEPYGSAPLFISYTNVRATQVAADNNAGESGKLMIYIGTEDGNVLRLRGMLSSGNAQRALLIESVKVSNKEKCEQNGCGVRSLHVSRPPVGSTESKPSAFVAFTDHMVQFPLVRCSIYKSKECCSVDPDCGWNGYEKCVQRTAQNNDSLIPTSKDGEKIPETCNAFDRIPTDLDLECNCGGNHRHTPCREEKMPAYEGLTIDRELLDIANGRDGPVIPPVEPLVMDLESILTNSILPAVNKKFRETVSTLRDNTQREALKQQLEEALSSTAELVIKNHRQEYCLPSPTVNHLTHVYPLLLREIEIWHETALKKMSDTQFNKKCWGRGQSKCTDRVSFSVPLVPILWEPLKKLIVNFSGKCEVIAPAGGELASFRPEPSTRCSPLPGTETCKDSKQPHCYAKRCQFPKYSIDVKAFFRHANDSRQFLEPGNHIEPFWKPVNVTIPGGESVRGHLELAVSEHKPFVIDYSPVAEKVKIMFHYSAVRDCALTDPMCVGKAPGCNPEVEKIIDHWFKYSITKLSSKMRKCTREIIKAKDSENRERRRRQGRMEFNERLEVTDRSDWLLYEKRNTWNTIIPTPDRCKYVGGKVRPLSSHPVTKNIWSLIYSRSQRAGGVYSGYHSTIEFYSLHDVLVFFKNMCTFEEPTIQRKKFRKRAVRGRSKSSIYIQPMVSRDNPFKIQRHISGKVFIKYFSMES
ncbi:uncharacterized protein LOC120346291 isoform X1 [Styela clava]